MLGVLHRRHGVDAYGHRIIVRRASVNADVRAADLRLKPMLRLVCLKVRPSDVIGLLFPIIRS